MPLKLEPAPTPPDAASDDPAGLLQRNASRPPLPSSAEIFAQNIPQNIPPTALEEAAGPYDPNLHPRWPAGTPGGLGGQFMKVGQVFTYKGKTWEIDHIFGNRVVVHEASGNYAAAQTREFDVTETGGKTNEFTGAQRPAPKSIKGGRSGSNVTVVDPYSDPSTHDPSLPLPANSSISAEDWKKFGRLEQLHYIDVQNRFGKHTASGASALIKKAYNEHDAETQSLVSQAYSSQYGSSSGWTLSLTSVFKSLFDKGSKSPAALEKARARRERARELQAQIRDAYAWDLYNRTHSPDVAMFHKDKHHKPSSWWKSKFIDGSEPIFSGLSQSHHFRSSFWSSQTGIASAISIRHVVMATWVAGPMQGAKKSFQSEREFAVPYQLKVDNRSMSFHNNEVPQGARDWLESQTDHPAGGDIFRMFKAHVEKGEHLPIPPPKAKIEFHGKDYLPPPPEAAEAMSEYHDKLPGGGSGSWTGTPADLAKFDLPWANVDENGHPVAKIASESGYNVGDFLMGKKGTLYWLGPDPSDTSGLGLRIHKLVPNGVGGLQVSNETFTFKDGIENYKLKGNVPPQTLNLEAFDPAAWTHATGDKVPIAKLQKGDKFKVDDQTYEITSKPGPAITTIRDLGSGIDGQINSDYQTLPLVPKEGYVPAGQLQPQKNFTFAYNGKKHTITRVTKDGVVSAKPVTAGSKIVKLEPDDPALQNLFDPGAWKAGGTLTLGDLQEGDLFHGGRGKILRPHKITGVEGNKVHFVNLDTGEVGHGKANKVVKSMLNTQGDGPDPTAEVVGPPQTLKNWDALDPGDSVLAGQLKVGDQIEVPHAGPTNSLLQITKEAPTDQEDGHAMASILLEDGSPGPEVPLDMTKSFILAAKNQPLKTESKLHHGYAQDTEIEIKKKYGDATWKAKVVGSGTSPVGNPTLDVQVGSGKVYTVKVENVITPAGKDPEALGPEDEGKVFLGSLAKGDTFVAADGQLWTLAEDPGTAAEDGDDVVMAEHPNGHQASMPMSDAVTPAVTKATTDALEKALADAAQPEGEAPGAATAHDIALDNLPDAVEASGFQPYKSAYGTGGKYKHDPIEAMPPQTVFQDKKGTLYKVQVAGPTPIITDGEQNFTINGKLRGRALPDEEWAGGEPLLPTETPAQSLAEKLASHKAEIVDHGESGDVISSIPLPEGYVPNSRPISELHVGTEFKMALGDFDYTVKVDTHSLDTGTTYVEVLDSAPDAFYQPGKLIAADPIMVPAPAAIKPPGTDPTPQVASQVLADYNPGDILSTNAGNEVEIVSHLSNGETVAKVNGQLKQYAPGDTLSTIDAEDLGPSEAALQDPAGHAAFQTAAPGDKLETLGGDIVTVTDIMTPGQGIKAKFPNGSEHTIYEPDVVGPASGPTAPPALAELEPDDEFENADGHPFKLVAHLGLGENEGHVVTKDLVTNVLRKYPGTTSLLDVKPEPPPEKKDAFAETVGVEAESGDGTGWGAVTAILDQLGEPDYTYHEFGWPTKGLDGFASAWGSGGKYKHPRISELAPGQKFRDKSKVEYVYLKALGAGMHLVYAPGTGNAYAVSGIDRVREL